jgi:flagellar biosynthetic protein FliP
MRWVRRFAVLLMIALLLVGFAHLMCMAAPPPAGATPLISLGLDDAGSPGKVSAVLQIFLLMTVLSLAPAILILLTSFTRIVIVLSLLRKALGTMQSPPNQIIIGLSLFLTIFIMTPVWQSVYKDALKPYFDEQMTSEQAFEKAADPYGRS